MRNPKRWALALSALVVVSALWIATRAEDPVSSNPPPIITAEPHGVSPGEFQGIASDPAGGEVVVSAYIEDGPDLGEDFDMEGEHNEFSFPIPEGYEGRTLVVVAEAEDGATTTERYPIL